MGSIIPGSSVILRWLIDYSIDTSIIIGLIFVIRFFTKKLPAWWHYTLWLILLLFMMVPMEFEKPANIPDIVPASIEENLYEFIFIKQESTVPEFRKETTLDPQGISSSQLDPQIQNIQNPQAQHIPVNDIFLAIWLASAISFGIYILIKNIGFWNRIRKEPPVIEEKVLRMMKECKARMKSHTPLTIVITDKVKSPALFGYIRPRLLLPVGIVEKLDEKELSYIFMHELGHLKRHDVAFAWLTMFLQAIHWFNPLVWLSFHIMRIDQESACDDFVLSRIRPGQSRDYGNAIIGFLDKFRPNRKVPAMAGIIESKSQIKRRMSMIINFRKYSKRKKAFTSIILIFICLVFFSITGFSKENQKPEEFDSPIIKKISLENKKDSIVTQVMDVEDKKHLESLIQKTLEGPVAVQEKAMEEKKEIVRLAAVKPENTIAGQDNEIESEAVPEKIDKKVKKAPEISQNKTDVLNNEKKIVTKEAIGVEPVVEDKDVPDNRGIIRLAEVTQKTSENKKPKNESESEELSSQLTRIPKGPQEKVIGQKPVKLSRQGQRAMFEAQRYLEKENYSEARQVLLDYIAKNPKTEKVSDQIYVMLGYLWFAEGEVEEARKVYKEGYEAYPENEYLFGGYAATLYHTGHYEEGKKMFKEAYEANPEERLLKNWAVNSYNFGQYKDASQLYERLYDTGKNKNVKDLVFAAQSNIKSKNWKEAKRLYKRLLDLPGNPEQAWLKNISAVCKRLNQPEEAEKYKKQLQELYGNAG